MPRTQHGLPGIYNLSPITLEDGAGAAMALDANGRVIIGSLIPGTGTTSLGKAEDAAHASGDTGVMSLGVRKDTPTALAGADGDYQPPIYDANGLHYVTLGSLISGENQTANVLHAERNGTPSYISTATTTVVKSGAGRLYGITVEGGTAGTIIVYDNTAGSGTVIASFDSTNALASYMFDVAFSTGLTVVTAAATKLTVSYR